MDLSLFQLSNIILLALLVILAVRFLWMTVFDPVNQPVAWKEAVKSGLVSSKLIRMYRFYPDKTRFFTWWLQVERLRRDNAHGAFAELGVYKGDSARLLHWMDPSRKFYLFDTFEGFPEEDLQGETGLAATYSTRNFADTSISGVLRRINGNGKIQIVAGHFPGSAESVANETFALVNIDADLYKPTKAGLEFFYPRLNHGGVLFVHDYNEKWPGVKQAADDFFQSIGETPVLIPDREGTLLVIKR